MYEIDVDNQQESTEQQERLEKFGGADTMKHTLVKNGLMYLCGDCGEPRTLGMFCTLCGTKWDYFALVPRTDEDCRLVVEILTNNGYWEGFSFVGTVVVHCNQFEFWHVQ